MELSKWYAAVLQKDFSMLGIFPAERPELEDRYRAEFLGYIQSANPLTEEIAKSPDYKGPKERVFTKVGGQYLRLVSGGRAQKRLSEITEKYEGFAAGLAREARKAAGWKTGPRNDYLITPDGKTTTSNGMKIGKLAMPWGDDDAGEFDGTIKPDTKFTR